MSGLDVEALLEETAKEYRLDPPPKDEVNDNDRQSSEARSSSKRHKDLDLLDDRSKRNESDNRSDAGSVRSSRRRSSRSPGSDRRRRRDDDDERYYRPRGGGGGGGGVGGRRRSRSPDDRDRYYRPDDRRDRRRSRDRRDRDRDDDYRRSDRRDRDRRDDRDKDRPIAAGGREDRNGNTPKSKSPALNEDERDRRTVFVQQLAARLRTRELQQFFEQVGPVREAQIVKDRVSGRSKGVGYVEFLDEESVPKALELTGQKLLGIPIIAQLTEAEKNRQARTTESSQTNAGAPFHRLYVGNIHFSITEEDLSTVFSPFGTLEFVQLQKDDQNRSRGYGFVQFQDADAAKQALESMNGFELASRPIRVGLGNDKFTDQSTANLLQRFPNGQQPGNGNAQASGLFGAGGRGHHAGGSANFDRAAGRDDRGAGGASALDDTDMSGVNFRNVSRDALMQKLLRAEDNTVAQTNIVQPAKTFVASQQASRCIKISNVFSIAEELQNGPDWASELEADIKGECESKYGPVLHCAVDKESDAGDVYVKFNNVDGGKAALQGLNGRYFGGRTLLASSVVDAIYNTKFGRAAGN